MAKFNASAIKHVEMGSVNEEQKKFDEEQRKVVDKLEDVYNFIKKLQINNDKALVNISKSLDDLQLSLKYLPTDPSFSDLPLKMKTLILSYLCDCNAFSAAAVCQGWKKILESRFKDEKVTIGKHCEECEDNECFKPAEMMKALSVHKMDVDLIICHPITEVDSKLIKDGLTSVAKFTITGGCTCEYDDDNDDSLEEHPMLSSDQLEDLIGGLEEKEEVMDTVKLERVDMTDLNQDRLATCLVTNINNLTLNEGSHGRSIRMLDSQTFITKLKDSAGLNLSHSTLGNFEHSDDMALDLADALCNVENINLLYEFPLKVDTVKRLIDNILNGRQPLKMKALVIEKYMNFRAIIGPEDLKKLFDRMERLRLRGSFTSEQLEAVKSLPDVSVKGTSTIFSKVLYCLDK